MRCAERFDINEWLAQSGIRKWQFVDQAGDMHMPGICACELVSSESIRQFSDEHTAREQRQTDGGMRRCEGYTDRALHKILAQER